MKISLPYTMKVNNSFVPAGPIATKTFPVTSAHLQKEYFFYKLLEPVLNLTKLECPLNGRQF